MLSLLKPALSQGTANLDTVPSTIEIDWFYLPIFPLFYRWSVGYVWLVVAGATLLFVLLPWLPPKRRGRNEFHVMVHPDNRIVAAQPGETLLDAALRDGIAFPFDCRNGGCGVCKCTLLSGRVDYGIHQSTALSKDEMAAGKALACCATPLTDVELDTCPSGVAGAGVVRKHRARSSSSRTSRTTSCGCASSCLASATALLRRAVSQRAARRRREAEFLVRDRAARARK